jgi:hypothetical protein
MGDRVAPAARIGHPHAPGFAAYMVDGRIDRRRMVGSRPSASCARRSKSSTAAIPWTSFDTPW